MTYRILIVDDSKLARMSVIKALKTLHPDWEWAEAANATEALDQVKQSRPDFVVLDFNMPGEDGVSLAAQLRKLDPRIRVAVISANRQAGVIERAEAAGAVFLSKPLTEKALGRFLSSTREPRKGPADG